MTGIEKLLEISNEISGPNYGAALVFELRKDKRNDEYFIKILKKNSIYPGVTKFNPIKIKGIFLNFARYILKFCGAIESYDLFFQGPYPFSNQKLFPLRTNEFISSKRDFFE